MRLVLQRVTSASVTVEGQVVGAIGRGVCVLVGITDTDTSSDVEFAARKILNTRLWPSSLRTTAPSQQSKPDAPVKQWDAAVVDIQGGGVLLVSQFTLCHVLKGNKPDFHKAMKTEPAKKLFDALVTQVKQGFTGVSSDNAPVATGMFGAYMDVQIANDGPVTLVIDSPTATVPPTTATDN